MNTALKWQQQFEKDTYDKTPTQLLHLYGDVNRVNFGDALEATQSMWKMRYIEYKLGPVLQTGSEAYRQGKEIGRAQGYKRGYNYWLDSKRFGQ